MKKFLLLIFFLNIFFANAQVGITNAGSLQIHTSASVTGFADLTNSSSGVLVNNGNFYLRGNISNEQSSMSAGTGTLYLNGTTAQAINGTQVFKTFNLVTNNAAGITLNNNLSTSGAHTYIAGMITTSATPDYLIYEAGSSYTGSGDTRHVNGWVKKLGNTSFSFPAGNGTYLRTTTIANLSTSSEFNCHYYRPTQNTNNLWSPLVQVKANEYWQLDKVSGGTAEIILNWDHVKVPMDNVGIPDILVAQYSSGNWTSAGGSAAGNVTSTGTITSDVLSSFGQVTFGYRSVPVPLKIISFTADRRSGTSFLHWISENEENVDRFDVQRSNDARTYRTIGNVAARNITLTQHYYFEDRSPLQGITYYRVKALDLDGKFSYTKIAAVTESQLSGTSFVVLNPVTTVITVFNKTGLEGIFNYRLFNAAGQLVLAGNTRMTVNGSSVLPLPEQSAAGVYVLELSNERTQFRKKILVEK